VWATPMPAEDETQDLDILRAPKNLQRLYINDIEPSHVLVVDDNPDDSVIEFGNALTGAALPWAT